MMHIPHARYHDRKYRPDGALQLLTRGSMNEWLVRGYDKAHEMSAKAQHDLARRDLLLGWSEASKGQLRFELQLRAPRLSRKGILTMSDVDPGSLQTMGRHYFGHARWDRSSGGDRRRQVLEDLAQDLKAADLRNVLVYLGCHDVGIDVQLTRHPLDRARAIIPRHNLLRHSQVRPRAGWTSTAAESSSWIRPPSSSEGERGR